MPSFRRGLTVPDSEIIRQWSISRHIELGFSEFNEMN